MAELKVTAKFDPDKCRQYLNGELSVFHCHHYTTLVTQLADDAELFDGERHLREAIAESMFPIMSKYCKENDISTKEDRASIGEQYFSYLGMGQVKIDLNSSKASMPYAHVDEGWIKKWGKRDAPVNYIGQGFVIAIFAIANELDISDYSIKETQSIVAGAPTSEFTISKGN